MCFLNMKPTSLAQIPWFSFTTVERGWRSCQTGEARPRAVRHLCSRTRLPSSWQLESRVFLSKSVLPVLFPFLLLYVFLSLAWFKALCLDVDVAQLPSATEHPPWQHRLCWQELFGLWDLILFGQANHNYGQKNAFFWDGYSGTVEIRSFFCLTDWQLVLLLMMVGKDVGCYN